MSSPLAANIVDAAALADELARFRVVDPARLKSLVSEFTGKGPVALAEHLVRRGVLTPFQAERALAGEARMLALGPYRLVGFAGRGTFGPLFAAIHSSKPGTFAVRILPLRSLWRAKLAGQLARPLAAGVLHPAVVPLIDVDSANGFHYLVWPHVEGERLADRVAATGPLEPGGAAALLAHLARAVASCHARGTIHGAITPQSVAQAPDGSARLLELGAGAMLAQNMADDESMFDTMSAGLASANVLVFAAPELAAEPDVLIAAADQYSLGATGYFAVTGLPPYPHPTFDELLRAKRTGAPPSASIVNPAVPAGMGEILERMMAPAPADRFGTLDEVSRRLAALAATGPAPAREALPAPPLTQLVDARRPPGSPRNPARAEPDDSEGLVQFDLPPSSETLPEALEDAPAAPGGLIRFGGIPDRASLDTPQEFPLPARLDAAPARGDPRKAAPTPVRWHPAECGEAPAASAPDGQPPAKSSRLWKRMKRNLLFWQAEADVIQVSVFGPAAATQGQAVKLVVFLHSPDAVDNVRTLSRAFHHDAELIGTGPLAREIPRASELAVHVSVANAGVAKALLSCHWRGQPRRLDFDLRVPWESPAGESPGLVSVGLDNLRVGKVEFRLQVLPRKS